MITKLAEEMRRQNEERKSRERNRDNQNRERNHHEYNHNNRERNRNNHDRNRNNYDRNRNNHDRNRNRNDEWRGKQPQKPQNFQQNKPQTPQAPNRNHDQPKVDNGAAGWKRPDTQALAGTAAILGAGALAMNGSLGPSNKYLKDSGKRAYGGAKKYMQRSMKPLHRAIFNVGEKSVKDVSRHMKVQKKRNPKSEAELRFEGIRNRTQNIDENYVKNQATKSFEEAKAHNLFEKNIAKQQNRKPDLKSVDPDYHFNKAMYDYMDNGPVQTGPQKPSKFNEYKGVLGSSILGGAGFALGVTSLHSLERSLESKKNEKENRERREQVFESLVIGDGK